MSDKTSDKHRITLTENQLALVGTAVEGPMDDLISRQAVLNMLRRECSTFVEDFLRNKVNALSSAQPEIIRCKDCEHWDTTWQNDFAPNYHYCPLVDGTRRDDFYCADAERRTDE